MIKEIIMGFVGGLVLAGGLVGSIPRLGTMVQCVSCGGTHALGELAWFVVIVLLGVSLIGIAFRSARRNAIRRRITHFTPKD